MKQTSIFMDFLIYFIKGSLTLRKDIERSIETLLFELLCLHLNFKHLANMINYFLLNAAVEHFMVQ